MKQDIRELIEAALRALKSEGAIPAECTVEVHVERARQKSHGDFASNVALALAKSVGERPRELAAKVAAALPSSDLVERVEIAGPGFINFFVGAKALRRLIDDIRQRGEAYGTSGVGAGTRVLVEYVSANPTGPLHVGHGRGAAYGDSLVRVLRAAGFDADAEYYVNDAGRQMDILALSVWLRYLELCALALPFPDNAYRGDYIYDIAAALHRQAGDALAVATAELMADLPREPEQRLDTLIERGRATLGAEAFEQVLELARDLILENIRHDLEQFAVHHDRWFSERALVQDGAVASTLEDLKRSGHLYESQGAWWFRSTDFGDEKDRVVLRANGSHTYFASDIAYHLDKMQRGYERLVDIWGADHHGHIARMQGALVARGRDAEALTVLLVQFAILYRGEQRVSMSTRGGEFVTLRELREEVGKDAARFFYALRKPEQHMDFDLELAKSQSNDNPVYYVQYAHARICSVFRQLEDRGMAAAGDTSADYALLEEDRELELLGTLSRFPEVVESAALAFAPHQVAYYLRELANEFHTYYNAHPFIAAQADLRAARLGLIDATRQVLANGLALLGVSAPRRM